jgi:amino acid permease
MAEEKFKKVLNRGDIFALAFGAMIGWSWVILSGDWIKIAGTLGAILAFVIGGLLVLLVGLPYAELTVAMPKCGGEHVFSMRALGTGGSFVCLGPSSLPISGGRPLKPVPFQR